MREMTADYIKMCAACYFRFARQYPIVTLEYWHYQDCCVQQDVLALDSKRRPVEIEVKVTLSDFKADANKHIWSFRNRGLKWPWKFYYAVPVDLIESVRPLFRDDCGLIAVRPGFENQVRPERAVSVVVKAPAHKDYEVVSDAKYGRIIAGQSAALCTALRKMERKGPQVPLIGHGTAIGAI